MSRHATTYVDLRRNTCSSVVVVHVGPGNRRSYVDLRVRRVPVCYVHVLDHGLFFDHHTQTQRKKMIQWQ